MAVPLTATATEGVRMRWQDQVHLDMSQLGTDEVLEAVMETCKFTDDRRLSAEAKSALKWNDYCWWAVPRSLAVIKDELRLMGGVYFRAWVCELDGVSVDGHIFANDFGCCQICGRKEAVPSPDQVSSL